jgi:hypothetical protein
MCVMDKFGNVIAVTLVAVIPLAWRDTRALFTEAGSAA